MIRYIRRPVAIATGLFLSTAAGAILWEIEGAAFVLTDDRAPDYISSTRQKHQNQIVLGV